MGTISPFADLVISPEQQAANSERIARERAWRESQHYVGDRFDADRPLDEVVRLVRQDIRDAIAEGILPADRYDVRARGRSYSAGSRNEINVYSRGERAHARGEPSYITSSDERWEIAYRVGDILRRYNRLHTDLNGEAVHFSVNFGDGSCAGRRDHRSWDDPEGAAEIISRRYGRT